MSTPFPPNNQQPFPNQQVSGLPPQSGYQQGAPQGFGAATPAQGPYGGQPTGRTPNKSNGGLIAAIIAGVFVITLIGGIVVMGIFSAATEERSAGDRTSSPSPTSTYSPTQNPQPSTTPSPRSTSTSSPRPTATSSSGTGLPSSEETGVMNECKAALGQSISNGYITERTVKRYGTNSDGLPQYTVDGTLTGTYLTTGKTGTYNFTCTVVYHTDSKLYEAWAFISAK